MSQTRILALSGSLRSASITRQLAEAAAQTAPEGVEVTVYDGLGEIPFYNEDIDVEGAVPAPAQRLRDAVADADGVLLVTPEYNGTLSAVLKNAIDWISLGTIGERFGAAHPREDAEALTELGASVHELAEAARKLVSA
ncbi:NADPH-dependent FMN reductase [Mycobacteroides abscessus subsp. abscessus]|nr:NADPH-dependent FMN reductase [Mycobacteroides abscessus subsp. abscessus]